MILRQDSEAGRLEAAERVARVLSPEAIDALIADARESGIDLPLVAFRSWTRGRFVCYGGMFNFACDVSHIFCPGALRLAVGMKSVNGLAAVRFRGEAWAVVV